MTGVTKPRGQDFWRSDEVPVSQVDYERMPGSGFGKAVLLTGTEQRKIRNSMPGTDCRQIIQPEVICQCFSATMTNAGLYKFPLLAIRDAAVSQNRTPIFDTYEIGDSSSNLRREFEPGLRMRFPPLGAQAQLAR